MRNAVEIGNGLVMTTDNSGGIGMKEADAVRAPDDVVGYFAARVCLLEQWAAGAEPECVIIHNFTGAGSWEAYQDGILRVFTESGKKMPEVTGSSETNMGMLQSAVAVTMIGRRGGMPAPSKGRWFLYGRPLVGEAVLAESGKTARLGKIRSALAVGLATAVWPLGSGGLDAEWKRLTGRPLAAWPEGLDPAASAGPSTAVLIRIKPGEEERAREHFGQFFGKVE